MSRGFWKRWFAPHETCCGGQNFTRSGSVKILVCGRRCPKVRAFRDQLRERENWGRS